MQIKKENLKVFKKITKNFVLTTTTVAVILTSPLFNVEAKANNIPDVNSYELSEDGSSLVLDGANDLSILKNISPYYELKIENSVINDTNELKTADFNSIVFSNCNINSNLEFSSAITSLTIDHSTINNPNALNNIQNVDSLTFTDCEFENLEILSKLQNVTDLSFSNCTIGSLKGIENLKNLNSLYFYAVGIEKIDELSALKNLSTLKLWYTSVKDLSPLENSNIALFDVSDSVKIDNFNVIKTMPNLVEFFAYNCEMSVDKDIIDYLTINDISTNLSDKSLAIKEAVYSIAKKINYNAKSTDEKIENIVQYVVDTMTYNEECTTDDDLLLETNNNALENALKGTGVCKSYTALTTALMRAEGIYAYEILGDGHIWNLVKLGDEYYWLDSTFIEFTDTTDITVCEDYMTQSGNFTDYNTPWYIPSSWYNQINGITQVEYNNTENNFTETNTQDNINKENVINIIKTKTLSGVSLIGILSALGFAVAAKKIKNNNKEKEKSKTK